MVHRVIVLGLFLLVPRWAQAQSGEEEQARAAFEQGVALADEGHCPEAIEQFWIAYRLVPERPSPLYAIGVCQMQLGGAENDRAALESFDQYLDRHDPAATPERLQEIRAHLTTLTGRLGLGTAQIDVLPDNAMVEIDGEEIPPGRIERVRLATGPHQLRVSAEGYEAQEREVDIVNGQTTELFIAPEPSTEPVAVTPTPALPRPAEPQIRRGIHQQWWFWTIIGAVVVGTTAGLAIGLQGDQAPEGDWRLDLQ